MKILKFNESINKKVPEVGDYVLIEPVGIKSISNFVKNNPGEIIKIGTFSNGEVFTIVVKYENVPDIISAYFNYISDKNIKSKLFYVTDILEIGSTLEELELNISTNKFNM